MIDFNWTDIDETGHSKWHHRADRVLAGRSINRSEARDILKAPSSELEDLLSAAFRIRKTHFEDRVRLHFLVNAKSGICAEDCSYCSQSRVSDADIDVYDWMDDDELLSGARQAVEANSCTYCIVAAGRGPSEEEVDRVCRVTERIKNEFDLNVCACLGLLTEQAAEKLSDAGVDRVNHNLNTSKEHYSSICSTHTYEDRQRTLDHVRDAGIEICSGVLMGMGEDERDAIDVAFALRERNVDSLPVNFLNPIPGTPLEGTRELSMQDCLKLLCLYRFTNPEAEIRIAGGREVHLQDRQELALFPANSLFGGNYLTTEGQEPSDDLEMIDRMGFSVELA